MIGFLVGTVCLIGLIKVLRHGRRCSGRGFGGYGGQFGNGGQFGYGGHGDDCGHHDGPGFGGSRWGRRGGGGFGGLGRGFWLRALLQRLDTTPGQEKTIREAFNELHATADKVRGDVKSARPEVAKAIRSEQFDETVFGDFSARIDEAAQQMRRAVVDAFAKVHLVLDERQRGILADFVESGPGWGRGGPYRSQWA